MRGRVSGFVRINDGIPMRVPNIVCAKCIVRVAQHDSLPVAGRRANCALFSRVWSKASAIEEHVAAAPEVLRKAVVGSRARREERLDNASSCIAVARRSP